MKTHYEKYGEILLIDATYKTNKYSLIMIILSGFTNTGRNCLFGVAIVDNEAKDTYNWLFNNFLKYKINFQGL